jgi:mono/diheme cytochrome c family protein
MKSLARNASLLVGVFALAGCGEQAVSNGARTITLEEPSATAYETTLAELLQEADPAQGDALIDTLDCGTCHRAGADVLAPGFAGLAQRAAQEKPPLNAAAYLLESIVFPRAHIVAGYMETMPDGYGRELSDRELGDVLAYLLTSDAR